MYNAGGLVEIEQRRAEEEDRRDDNAREERRHADRLLALPAQQEEEHALHEEDDDRERGEGAERVHVVRAGELHCPGERVPDGAALDEKNRNHEPDEGKPRKRREHERGRKERDGDEHGGPDDERQERAAVRPQTGRDRARADVRRRGDHASCRRDDDPRRRAPERRHADTERGRSDTERERRPETSAVQPNRLGDELPHGARLWRQRGRKRRHVPTLSGRRASRSMSYPAILRLVHPTPTMEP